MIARRFVFTKDSLTETNINRISEGRKLLAATKTQRGVVILVRNPGKPS